DKAEHESHATHESHKHGGSTSSTTTVDSRTSGPQSPTGAVHTAASDDVRVRSSVTSDTQSKVAMENTTRINELLQKLGTTHTQVDDYSKQRTDKINQAVNASIQKVVADTRTQQEQLLQDANVRTKAFEEEYKVKLEAFLDELNVQKAKELADMERELNARQQGILDQARQRIDQLNSQANDAKLNVMKEAQAQINAQVEGITDQVQHLGAEDAARHLQSTTTTVITSQA
ncbi:unnamed protein product, partial [Didymodactylos carnosus]